MEWLRFLHIIFLIFLTGAFFFLIRRLVGTPVKGFVLLGAGVGLALFNLIINSILRVKFITSGWDIDRSLFVGEASEYVIQTAALILLLLGSYRLVLSVLPHLSEYYSSLVEHSLVGVCFIQDGVFKFVNPRLAEIFGYGRTELLDKNVLDLVAPEARAVTAENLKKRISGEEPTRHYEFRGLRRDGEKIDIEVHGTRVMYQGRPAVHASLLDITERKRAEQALQDSEKRYRTMFESNPLAMYVYDIKTLEFLAVNDASVDQYGFTRDEFLRMTVKEIRPPEEVPVLLEQLSTRPFGPERSGIWKHWKKDGTIMHVEMTSYPMLFEGRQARLVLANDVTERLRVEEVLRESEMKYRQLIDHSTDAIFIADQDGRLLLANPKSCEMLGYTPDELLRLNIVDTYPTEDRNLAFQRMREVRTGKVLQFERRMQRKDGSFFPVEVSLTLRPDGVFQGIVRDITERKRAQQSLIESETELRLVWESTLDGMRLTDEQGIVHRVNEAYCRLMGKSKEALEGHPMSAAYAEARQAEILEKHRKRFRERSIPQHLEREVTLWNGKTLQVELSNAFLTLPGQPDVVLSVFRDITDRKRAEDAIHESEQKFRDLADQSPNMIFINKKGRVVYVNKKSEEMMGYTREEFYSPDFNFLQLIAPESMDLVKEAFNRHQRGEEVPPYEYAVVTKRGKRIVGIHTTKLIPYEGDYAILGIVTDITERKRAEAALEEERSLLRTLVEAIPDEVAIKDRDGKFVLVNRAVVGALGVKSHEDVIGKHDSDFMNVENAQINQEEEQAILRAGEPVVNRETLRLDQMTGQIDKCTLATKIPLRDSKGQIWGIIVLNRHITERKRVEEALERERNLLRTLIDNLPDLIYVKDMQGRFMVSNTAVARLFGAQTPDEIVGRTDFDFFMPELAERYHADEQEIIQSGQSMINREEPVTDQAGNERWVLTTKVPLRDNSGKIIGLVGMNRDITERKQTEVALRESEERYRTLFDNAPIGIYRTTPDGNIVNANPALLKMLGYRSFNELAARDLEKEGFEPSYSRSHFKERIEQEGGISGLESKWFCRNNSVITVRENARAIRGRDGKVLYYEGTVEDITEQKQAEEALRQSREWLRAMFNASRDGIVVEQNETIVYANKSFASLYGYDDPEELIDEHVSIVQSDEFNQQMLEFGKRRLRGEPVPTTYEFKGKRKEGTLIDLEASVSTFKVDKAEYIITVLRDMAERKQLEEQLRQAQKMESIGTLAGGIAHDFNNILGIILGHASLLEGPQVDPAKVPKRAEAITKAGQRGASLVRQLLTFARKTEVRVESVRVNDMVKEMVKLLEETFPKTITYSVQLDERIPSINADANQLHQAVLNLAINARDAMLAQPLPGSLIGQAEGTLSLKTEMIQGVLLHQRFPEAREEQYACISVRDTGVGMDDNTKSHLFEPFFTTKERGKGTGLGLAVVYGIVKSHQGFIDVESELGRGTTFYLYIPVPPRGVEAFRAEAAEVGEAPEGTETILVVEDEEMLLALVRALLEEKGYRVLAATDGIEALEVFEKNKSKIALVLMDVGLPRLEGWEVLQKLKEIDPGVRVILASGYVEPHMKSEMLKAGAKHFVQKPYVPAEILRRVREVIDRTRSK